MPSEFSVNYKVTSTQDRNQIKETTDRNDKTERTKKNQNKQFEIVLKKMIKKPTWLNLPLIIILNPIK